MTRRSTWWVLPGWLLLVGAVLCLAAVYGCSGAQKSAPPSVDETSFCFAAVLAGEQETIGCAETAPACEAARTAALPTATAISDQCFQVQLRLDRLPQP